MQRQPEFWIRATHIPTGRKDTLHGVFAPSTGANIHAEFRAACNSPVSCVDGMMVNPVFDYLSRCGDCVSWRSCSTSEVVNPAEWRFCAMRQLVLPAPVAV